jgi:cytidylate kinase
VAEVILALAAGGDVLLAGRGGQAVLAGQPGVLHVRIIAPRPQRVATVQERCLITPEAAAARVQASDQARTAYLRRHYGLALNDPALYDLVLNLARLDVDAAAAIICLAASRLSGAGPQPVGNAGNTGSAA